MIAIILKKNRSKRKYQVMGQKSIGKNTVYQISSFFLDKFIG